MQYVARGIAQLARLSDLVARLSPATVWVVDIKQYRGKRSAEQNNFAWKLYREVAKAAGYNDEAGVALVHQGYAEMFGMVREVVNPITKATTREFYTKDTDTPWFSEYLERVIAHAATEYGVVVDS